ncbi:MAG: putative cellulose biosynthesis protein CelD [Parcubacteria group bacterium Gr01-1014_66]|nr:MAG: putative cellulose biosynthesis protein CelD [Parcubacteria group bacterium Gr01-1014_66]
MKSVPEHEVHYNNIIDFDRLVELNIKQYGEYSRFNNPLIKKGISRMVELAHKKGILEMISIEINGRIEGVDAAVIFGNWYHTLIGGVNNQRVPNLGKLMNVLDIKNAIAKKAGFVDFFATSGYWKELWGFDKEMLFKFLK